MLHIQHKHFLYATEQNAEQRSSLGGLHFSIREKLIYFTSVDNKRTLHENYCVGSDHIKASVGEKRNCVSKICTELEKPQIQIFVQTCEGGEISDCRQGQEIILK